MREWIWRFTAMLRRKRMTLEKTEELQLHLDMEIEAGMRQGLTLEEARRRARIRVGLISEALESTRDELGFRWLDGTVLDLRHAFRALTRNRKFGVMAVVVLAASVAINTVIFCMLEGVVLRPLPYAAPERLVRLYDQSPTTPNFPMAIGHYLDCRAHARSLEAIALYTGQDVELAGDAGRSRRLTGMAITSDYFSLLGRPPAIGRAFTDDDLRTGVKNAVISHRLWEDHFGSDPAIVGKTVRIDRQPWTVIGVAAAGLQHVGGDYRSPIQGESVDVWLPLAIDLPEQNLRAYHYTNAIARIRSGVMEEAARQELDVLAANYANEYPDYGQWRIRIAPLLDEVTGRSRELVWLLVAAGGLVLLLACINIAGLSVARAVARERELSLRLALGANRWQLVRVGLAENLLIGVTGALIGLALADAGLPVLRHLLPADFPRAHEIALTALGALFGAAVAIATALLAGLRPPGRPDSLQSHQRVASSRDLRRLRTLLVVGEFTLAGVLCAGALFLLRSYQQIGARDHGFNPAGVLTVQLTIPSDDADHRARVQEDILAAIRDVPGVAAVGATSNLPWSGYDENTTFGIVGASRDQESGNSARFQAAAPGYFESIGARLLAGRLFDRMRDGGGQSPTVIVNDALADRYFPDGKAVGALVDLWGKQRQIVGVVAGIKDFPADLDTKPAFWFPLAQSRFASVYLAVRAAKGDPASLTAAVVNAVHAVDPELAVADTRTLESRTRGALAARRFALSLFQAFAVLALVLAAAGVYGLLAYIVQQRRKELGIRAALGASRSDLARMIVSDGLRMAATGALLCLVLIPLGGSLLQSFLYNVKPFDLFTIAGAPVLLLGVALLASVGPARSATQSDPALVLRDD